MQSKHSSSSHLPLAMDSLNIPCYEFSLVFRLQTSHKCSCSHTICRFCLQLHPIINKLSILTALYQSCSYPAQICDSNHKKLPTVSANHPSRLRNNVQSHKWSPTRLEDCPLIQKRRDLNAICRYSM